MHRFTSIWIRLSLLRSKGVNAPRDLKERKEIGSQTTFGRFWRVAGNPNQMTAPGPAIYSRVGSVWRQFQSSGHHLLRQPAAHNQWIGPSLEKAWRRSSFPRLSIIVQRFNYACALRLSMWFRSMYNNNPVATEEIIYAFVQSVGVIHTRTAFRHRWTPHQGSSAQLTRGGRNQ